jgi:hypothetical protein
MSRPVDPEVGSLPIPDPGDYGGGRPFLSRSVDDFANGQTADFPSLDRMLCLGEPRKSQRPGPGFLRGRAEVCVAAEPWYAIVTKADCRSAENRRR